MITVKQLGKMPESPLRKELIVKKIYKFRERCRNPKNYLTAEVFESVLRDSDIFYLIHRDMLYAGLL